MKTLNNLVKSTKLGLTGLGLIGILGFNGCSVMENMSDAEALSAAGAGLGIFGKTSNQVGAGIIAEKIGNNQVDKEVAREGKTEVTTNINYNTPKEQSKNLDYTNPKLISFNTWVDFNNNKIAEKDEFFGLGKTVFNLDKEKCSISYSNGNYIGDVNFRSWKSTGELIGETIMYFERKDIVLMPYTKPGDYIPGGDFIDKVRCAGPGDYRITVTETGTGKSYLLDIKLVSDKQ